MTSSSSNIQVASQVKLSSHINVCNIGKCNVCFELDVAAINK